MSRIVSSRNIYLDSSNGIKGKGDNFELFLPSMAFTVKDGQYLRFTVQSLLGYKNWTNIHDYNSYFRLKLLKSDGTETLILLNLTHLTHNNVQSLADDFLTVVINAINNQGFPTSNQVNATVNDLNNSRGHNKQIKGSMTVSADNNGVTLTGVKFLFYRVNGIGDNSYFQDVHLILGGRPNTSLNTAINGMYTSINQGTLSISSLFPAQLSTLTHVFLRSSLVTDHFQNHHFDSSKSAHDNYLIESTIMCKAPVHDEFFSFDSYEGHGSGYFVNCASKSITNIIFNLTTDKDQILPQLQDQNIYGGLSCQLVLRCDVIATE